TLGTAALAPLVAAADRGAFLARHFALYAAVPLILLVLRFSEGSVNARPGTLSVLLAFAFAAHALGALWRALPALTDRRAAVALAGIALVVYLALVPYHRAVQPTASDEPHYLLIVQSLLLDGDVDLRNDYEGDRYRVFYPDRLPDVHGIEVGDAVYPIRDLGLPLLAALPYALGGRDGVLALICLAGAALALQLYLLLRDLRFAPRLALLAVAAVAFTHPVLTYTTQIYPELIAALVFVSAARVLRAGDALRTRDLALASALVAVLPWLSTRAWLIAVGLGLAVAYWALRPLWARTAVIRARGAGERQLPTSRPPLGTRLARAARSVAAGLLPFALIVGALAYANWLMFGLFLPSAGYYIIRDQQQVLAYTPHVGGLGLFFDRVFGLVGRAPLYLLAFVGAVALYRRARGGHGAAVAALFLGWLLSFGYIANIAYWWADGSPPSRYLLATIPFLAVGVAAGSEVIAEARRWRAPLGAVAWATGALSLLVVIVYAAVPNVRYDLALRIAETGGSGRLWELLGRTVRPDPAAFLPSLVQPGLLAWLLSAGWLVAAIGLGLLGGAVLARAAEGGSEARSGP
ncbi:MAG: hypothetical protein ACRDGE_12125, partial [Candidatus Limnocylindria bacterium]